MVLLWCGLWAASALAAPPADVPGAAPKLPAEAKEARVKASGEAARDPSAAKKRAEAARAGDGAGKIDPDAPEGRALGEKVREAKAEVREAAEEAKKELREARDQAKATGEKAREEMRETMKEARQEMRAAGAEVREQLQAAREEVHAAGVEVREQMQQARDQMQERWRELHGAMLEAMRKRGTEMREAADATLARVREARRRAWGQVRAALHEGKDVPAAVSQEMRHHARRMARLVRVLALAEQKKDTASVERVKALIGKEQERHDRKMDHLLGLHTPKGEATAEEAPRPQEPAPKENAP